ncbi:ABC transporter substrate-binding protein [Auraticoccus monumenti]|uniref:ABC-type glycerol-3-phosphate transport system, substrate-binding protein n=1 Tax=Auraticoccus monumenti TaxID=675864 RepID=A0A1G6Y907_9ACTN|nr:extracellular solute-binding protein [Auraticoccus monumenti]SDD86055.1 ABC-type glycerol-3-phosphate transport system, substrate-binding protein [Auraticoccus monumenti]
MTFDRRALTGPAALALTSALLLTGCSSTPEATPPAEVDTAAPVTISVGGKPTAEKPEELAAYERRLEQFRTEHANITVEPEETLWEADTFQALLAGGQLPTVFNVPFTEMQGLIARQQVADVTDFAAQRESLSSINPAVNQVVESEGRSYGVPIGAYSMGLLYNRALFAEAGLDPDAPPATWEEVREAARAIDERTDAQGYGSMTVDATGGWVLTTTSYGFGGTMESEDGTQATVDNEATREVLEMYRQMRWEDNTFGSNFLLNYEDANNAFAAGQVGMFVQGADNYATMVVNKGMDPQDFGVAPLPQAEDGLGTLGGGTVAIVNPTATPEEINAAMEWIDFQTFDKFTDEAAARADAEAAAADGLAVGAPSVPVLDAEAQERYLGWIEEYVNVPRENYADYLGTVETLPLVPEPATKAQEVYSTLDPVVQAVLTREDADVDELLAEAQATAQSAIDIG